VPEESDLNLVKRARNGEKGAFRVLVERYQRKVYSIAYNVVRNHEDAMDLSQDAFVKVFKNLQGFQGQSSFYTWLYRIVVNLGIDHLRKRGRVRHVDYDDKFLRDNETAQGNSGILPSQLGTNPRKALARKELMEQIHSALESLSENHRMAIVLREIEGLSYLEMAEVLGISKGTVMSRLFHARKNMQDALQGYVGRKLSVE
jgi:RNA polymerase sigma-70 factor (ECF subfamily)